MQTRDFSERGKGFLTEGRDSPRGTSVGGAPWWGGCGHRRWAAVMHR